MRAAWCLNAYHDCAVGKLPVSNTAASRCSFVLLPKPQDSQPGRVVIGLFHRHDERVSPAGLRDERKCRHYNWMEHSGGAICACTQARGATPWMSVPKLDDAHLR
jgi:hypothetical protein